MLSLGQASFWPVSSVSDPTGVAEQFAIAEAKLRAWSSVDGEDSTDESYDEDYAGTDSGKEPCQESIVHMAFWSELNLWERRPRAISEARDVDSGRISFHG